MYVQISENDLACKTMYIENNVFWCFQACKIMYSKEQYVFDYQHHEANSTTDESIVQRADVNDAASETIRT